MDETTTNHLIASGVVVVVTFIAYMIARWLGARFVAGYESKGSEKAARAATLWSLIRRVVAIALFVTAFFLVLSIWDVDMTAFLAVGATFGAALGFGAQDLVRDFLAGFFILAEDQYQLGDTVTIAGTTGTVEDIQLRVTVLRDLEGNVHYVPNGHIEVASNFTSIYAHPVLDIGVGYSEDTDTTIELIMDELNVMFEDEEWRDAFRGEPEALGVQELADSAVVLRFRLTTDADLRWAVRREALRRVKKRLDVEGIEIPFPQRTIHTVT